MAHSRELDERLASTEFTQDPYPVYRDRFPKMRLAQDDVVWQPSVHVQCPLSLALDTGE